MAGSRGRERSHLFGSGGRNGGGCNSSYHCLAYAVEVCPAGDQPLRADVLVLTTNADWQPRPSGLAVSCEIEKLGELGRHKSKEYSGGAAVYIMQTVTVRVDLPTQDRYDLWLRAYDNGSRDIGVRINGGKKLISDYLVPIRWWKIGSVEGVQQVEVTLSREGVHNGSADALVCTSDAAWSPQPHQIDLLGHEALPPDVPRDMTPPVFDGLQKARREGEEIVLRWNPAREEEPHAPRVLGFHYLDDQTLPARAGYLFDIGWDGINTIGAQWYETPQAIRARIPAYKQALDAAKAAGLSVFFVKKALSYRNLSNPHRGEFLPNWFNDEGWAKQVENFRATGEFARVIGATGLALDQELYSTSHDADMAQAWELSRWEKKGHTPEEVYAQVRQRGRQCAEAFVAEFPAGEIMFFPSFFDARNPMSAAWYAGFFDVEPPGGVILGTEWMYRPRGSVMPEGWLEQCTSAEALILKSLEPVLAEHRDYWEQKCSFAHGAWPLHKAGANYNPEVFRRQLTAFAQHSRKYVWMYTDGATWYAPEEQRRLNPEVEPFDNSEYVTVLCSFNGLIRYHIYVAPQPGRQDFSRPAYTVLDRTELRLTDLGPGPHYFVVRAVDRAGNEEKNTRELAVGE